NDHFVVERSADGINFTSVGMKAGAGNSSVTLYYSLVDYTPLKGISYYRLRQVDFDGAESYSQLVAVSFLDNNVLAVYPNPAKNDVQYSFNASADGTGLFELIDALGKTVVSREISVAKGQNVSDPMDIHSVPNGVYFIRVKPLSGRIFEPMQKLFVKRDTQE